MPKQVTMALVVARPGHLGGGLQSLLRTVPQIEIIAETKDPAVLLRMGAEMQPDLVLLDASLFDEDTWSVLTKNKSEWTHTQYVVLVADDQQRQKAEEAGAELVLPEGFPAAKLVASIEALLSQRENDNLIKPDSQDKS